MVEGLCVRPSVCPLRLLIFGGIDVLLSTAWTVLALVSIEGRVKNQSLPSVLSSGRHLGFINHRIAEC